MNLLSHISGTACIEVNPQNFDDELPVTVYMDYHIYIPPCKDWAAEYDQSDPYILVGKYPGKKVKAFLTPLELDELEDKVHNWANGVNS